MSLETNEQVHLVLFRLGEQCFALPVEDVYQIIEMVSIIRLPKVEALIEGVINVRGKMAPVVDLRCALKKGAPTRGLNTPLILVNVKNQLTGIIVDEVLNVIELPSARISRLEDFMPADAAQTPILQGIANPADDCVMVLDLDHLFEPGQGEALSQMAESLEDVMRQTATAVAESEEVKPSVASEPGAALEGRHAGRPLREGNETVGADLGVCSLPVEQAASPLRDEEGDETPDAREIAPVQEGQDASRPLRDTDEQKLPAEDKPPARHKTSRAKRAKAMQSEAVLKMLKETLEAGE